MGHCKIEPPAHWGSEALLLFITTGPIFGLWSKVFPGYLRIRKALKANQPDARGSGRSFAEVALATPIYVSAGAVEGIGYPTCNRGVGFWLWVIQIFCAKCPRGLTMIFHFTVDTDIPNFQANLFWNSEI